ncbi:ribonuclease H-like domain-containing protein [Tanacetum coccineum]|uniref:Ribonuclease H-like domain-containing protein n=1 Tax=Tanacetum coccineum TaxID=301880 RepID=A0ABQ4YL19_9ASTR
MQVNEAEKKNEAGKEEITEVPSSQPVEYYLKHRINKKLIEGLGDNRRGPVYEAILRKKITRKEDIGGNFEIPCNIGGLKHINALVDQGSDVNAMPLSTYMKLTDERPAETNIKLSLVSHSYIYPLGIAEDILVEGVVKLLVEVPYDNRINDEYNALVKNGTWILVLRPTDANLVHSMWLFKHKFHADGTLSRYKARLVANGSSQQLGVDFDETFSLVVKLATIHTVLSLAGSQVAYLPIYVDDIILTASSTTYLARLKTLLLKSCLFLSQKKYALDLLARAHMVNFQQVCLYMHDPKEPHFAALKRILCYVQGTLELGLHLYASATTSLVGYTDADWVVLKLKWVFANVVADETAARNLLRELHSPLLTATLVYCDNVSVVYMSANPVQHERTNHIEIDIHFVRDMVKAGHVRVLHIPSRFQYADIFTKCLPSALFEDFRFSLSVHPPPAQTAGAY